MAKIAIRTVSAAERRRQAIETLHELRKKKLSALPMTKKLIELHERKLRAKLIVKSG